MSTSFEPGSVLGTTNRKVKTGMFFSLMELTVVMAETGLEPNNHNSVRSVLVVGTAQGSVEACKMDTKPGLEWCGKTSPRS